jgi:hypothetical protein
MSELASTLSLVVTSETAFPDSEAVWGTGGWQHPEDREALDWLTLASLLGWRVTILRKSASPGGLTTLSSRIVVAGSPDLLTTDIVSQLASRLAAEPCLVIARAGFPDGELARLAGVARGLQGIRGRGLRWIGPGPDKRWSCRNEFQGHALDRHKDTAIWATVDDIPTVVARGVGRGVIATIGFHPSDARDKVGAATALLQRLLIWGVDIATAWFDWSGTLLLRMDDPGSAEAIHHSGYSHRRLDEAQWAALGSDLARRRARLSIGYVSGWVDDGDSGRGVLRVGGRAPRRIPGKVHPSPLVCYEDISRPGRRVVHDYAAEFRGIQALRKAGVADVELHGHTHIHPNTKAWAKALDRYESVGWYRELGKAASAAIASRPAARHPLALGMAAFRRFFKTTPTTLICPGEEWTNSVLQRAHELNVQLVGSYYLAFRHGDRFCWSQHVCAPYLDRPDPDWFDAELPVVGYFHDFDLVRKGVEWVSRWLDAWQSAGATRFIDFRELSAALSRRLYMPEHSGERLELHVSDEGDTPIRPVRPLRIAVKSDKDRLPAALIVFFEGQQVVMPLDRNADGVATVELTGALLPPAPPNPGRV